MQQICLNASKFWSPDVIMSTIEVLSSDVKRSYIQFSSWNRHDRLKKMLLYRQDLDIKGSGSDIPTLQYLQTDPVASYTAQVKP